MITSLCIGTGAVGLIRGAFMQEIIDNLWIGNDADYVGLDRRGWYVIRACKEGPGGHRDTLGYGSLGAPRGEDYLLVHRGNKLALNLIDHAELDFIPEKVIATAIRFIAEHIGKGRVLVACNHGRSRSAIIVALYLRRIGDFSDGFTTSMATMKKIYPPFDPNSGMLEYARIHWND